MNKAGRRSEGLRGVAVPSPQFTAWAPSPKGRGGRLKSDLCPSSNLGGPTNVFITASQSASHPTPSERPNPTATPQMALVVLAVASRAIRALGAGIRQFGVRLLSPRVGRLDRIVGDD